MRSYLAEFLGAFFLVFVVLSTTAVSHVLAAATTGTVLVGCVWVGAHISGAHFNPAVTLGVFLRGGLSMLDLWSYWAAQLLGALAASVVALGIPAGGSDSGSRVLSTGLGDLGPTLVVEVLFTFALVYVALSIAASRRQEHNLFLGLAMGVVVLAGMLAASSTTSAALNPAVAFGLSVDGALGWPAVGALVVAELVGATLAAVLVSRTQPA